MSASRSVAAAQRRRAGPPEVQPVRGPNTSIQSSQAFSQQQPMRPGTTGRLAGQQAAINQQQMQQQMQQNQQSQQMDSNSRPKMTIPQAITLITLRLGRLENQMQNLDTLSLGQYDENGELQKSDSAVIASILQRLDAIEQKTADVSTFKQQLDVFKPALVSIKNVSIGNVKEVKTLKDNVDQMKYELSLTKTLVTELQGLVNGYEEIASQHETNINSNGAEAESQDNAFTPIVNLKDIIEQELSAPDSA